MLSKIKYQAKRDQIIENIKDFNNCSTNEGDRHAKRLNTIGFLGFCGYNEREICDIILNYNPSLASDTARRKFVNPIWIRENILSFSKKSIRRKPSLCIKGERSSPYISDSCKESVPIVAANVEQRYNMIPLDCPNKKFFKGANIIAYGYKDKEGIEKYNIYGNMNYYNPVKVPVYRSIGGVDHVLFVADLDKSNFNNSLEETREFALKLSKRWNWDIIKFSGSEGFHLIKYMPKDTSIEMLQRAALILDPDKNKLDWHMFQTLDWKIRGYCVNLKTGKMSKNVNLGEFKNE